MHRNFLEIYSEQSAEGKVAMEPGPSHKEYSSGEMITNEKAERIEKYLLREQYVIHGFVELGVRMPNSPHLASSTTGLYNAHPNFIARPERPYSGSIKKEESSKEEGKSGLNETGNEKCTSTNQEAATSSSANEEATEEATEDGTEEATEDGTEDATKETTEEATENVTKNATEQATEGANGEATEEAAEIATEDATEEATEDATRETTEEATENVTKNAIEQATEDATEEATEDATEEATEDATRETTEEATENVTKNATEQATEDANGKATEEVAEIATEDATEEATEDATRETTEETTENVTKNATEQATEDANGEATEEAAKIATEDATKEATEDATKETAEEATEDVNEEATEDVNEEATEEATPEEENVAEHDEDGAWSYPMPDESSIYYRGINEQTTQTTWSGCGLFHLVKTVGGLKYHSFAEDLTRPVKFNKNGIESQDGETQTSKDEINEQDENEKEISKNCEADEANLIPAEDNKEAADADDENEGEAINKTDEQKKKDEANKAYRVCFAKRDSRAKRLRKLMLKKLLKIQLNPRVPSLLADIHFERALKVMDLPSDLPEKSDSEESSEDSESDSEDSEDDDEEEAVDDEEVSKAKIKEYFDYPNSLLTTTLTTIADALQKIECQCQGTAQRSPNEASGRNDSLRKVLIEKSEQDGEQVFNFKIPESNILDNMSLKITRGSETTFQINGVLNDRTEEERRVAGAWRAIARAKLLKYKRKLRYPDSFYLNGRDYLPPVSTDDLPCANEHDEIDTFYSDDDEDEAKPEEQEQNASNTERVECKPNAEAPKILAEGPGGNDEQKKKDEELEARLEEASKELKALPLEDKTPGATSGNEAAQLSRNESSSSDESSWEKVDENELAE